MLKSDGGDTVSDDGMAHRCIEDEDAEVLAWLLTSHGRIISRGRAG